LIVRCRPRRALETATTAPEFTGEDDISHSRAAKGDMQLGNAFDSAVNADGLVDKDHRTLPRFRSLTNGGAGADRDGARHLYRWNQWNITSCRYTSATPIR
jgi:hypothetical protein